MEFVVGQLVSRLKLTIILGPLLNCIIGQVNELVLELAEYVLSARRSQVAFVVDVNLQITIHCGTEHICTDVELSAMDKERIVDVLLDDACSAAIGRRLLHNLLNLIIFTRHLNTMTSVCVFSWLDDPNVLGSGW